jgi:DNA-binding transcriptional LysR family regulator
MHYWHRCLRGRTRSASFSNCVKTPAFDSPNSLPLDAELLHRFLAVAKYGGFTAAAKHLRMAQPALSRAVKALESELGTRLIERTSRRFLLTEAGERVALQSATVFEHLAAVRQSVQPTEVHLAGTLRIGVSELVAHMALSETLRRFIARHGGVHPYVVIAPSDVLQQRLLHQELDAVVTFNAPRVREGASRLRKLKITDVGFGVAIAKGKLQSAATAEYFLGSREIEEPEVRTFPALQKWRSLWPKARIRLSTNCTRSHLELVRAGIGVSILPEALLREDLAQRRLLCPQGARAFEFPLMAVTSTTLAGPKSDAAQAFVETLRGTLR